jgi:hypothetical protein
MWMQPGVWRKGTWWLSIGLLLVSATPKIAANVPACHALEAWNVVIIAVVSEVNGFVYLV